MVKRKIAVVLLAGMVLLLADFISAAGDALQVYRTDGQLYIMRPEADTGSGVLSLIARIDGEKQSYEKKLDITLEPYSENPEETKKEEKDSSKTMTEEERWDYQLRLVADELNKDTSLKRVKLPSALDTGESISWSVEKTKNSNAVAILALTALISVIIYRNRFADVKKHREECRESVMAQLPEFVNRLTLLLNAGMVLSSAFEQSVKESLRFNRERDDYFNNRLEEIYTSVRTANGSLHKEFGRFARESGVKELMRVSNIISDNINKGVELTEKLQSESELLWMDRKKRCEERGRLAETKLTLPLVIFLMVLIVITVAPALLEL